MLHFLWRGLSWQQKEEQELRQEASQAWARTEIPELRRHRVQTELALGFGVIGFCLTEAGMGRYSPHLAQGCRLWRLHLRIEVLVGDLGRKFY